MNDVDATRSQGTLVKNIKQQTVQTVSSITTVDLTGIAAESAANARIASLGSLSGGELHVALSAGFPAARIVFHGNNKSDEELASALAAGVSAAVIALWEDMGQASVVCRTAQCRSAGLYSCRDCTG